jgi:calcium and integrin-binding protein 1
LIRRLVGDSDFEPDQIDRYIKLMGNQSDLDDDGMVSFSEFEHIVAKSQDFEK